MVERIVSGGQTGADRGGLEAAIALGIPHGGWCPKGRRAEDGRIPARYTLRETSSEQYYVRTRRNVRDSDGTLLFARGSLAGGSLLTARAAREAGKPLLIVEMAAIEGDPETAANRLRHWLAANRIRTLNVAGARESKVPGIEADVTSFLTRALAALGTPSLYAAEGTDQVLDAGLPAAADAPATYRRRLKRS